MGATIHWYANDGTSKGVLDYDEAIHEEDLDGTDRLTVVCRSRPNKRDRLVWKDNAGEWHEHMVDHTTEMHDGHDRVTVDCLNSIAELIGVRAAPDTTKGKVSEILTALLDNTRWGVGTCSNGDLGVQEVESYHKRVRECIQDLVDMTNGELVTTITVGESGVTGRSVGIRKERGAKRVRRAFEYRKNMASARREVCSDEVYTAVVGYGAKERETSIQAKIDALEAIAERTEAQEKELRSLRKDLEKVRKNEYAKRLAVTVESNLSRRRWGIPNGPDSYGHHWYVYTDAQCTDAVFLKKQCDSIKAAVCRPVVVYSFEVAEGDSDMWSDVKLGNRVLVVDRELGIVPDDPLEDRGKDTQDGGSVKRISHIRRKLSGRMSCVIEVGERTNPLVEQFKAAERVSKAATGNGTKVAAKKPVRTGGNYSSDGYGGDYSMADGGSSDGYGGGYDSASDPSTPEGAGLPRPYAIAVVTPPSKTEYYESERIDYSGIEVQLLNQDGSVFTDGNYPDGVIPFDELIKPMEFATPDGSGTQVIEGFEIEGVSDYLDVPFAFTQGSYINALWEWGSSAKTHIVLRTDKTVNETILNWPNTGTGVEDRSETFVLASSEPFGWSYWVNYSDDDPDTQPSVTPVTGQSSEYTVDGRTVHQYVLNYRGDRHRNIVANVPVNIAKLNLYDTGIPYDVAWEMVYSDRIIRNGGVPVQWESKYGGGTLEASFQITIRGSVADKVGARAKELAGS